LTKKLEINAYLVNINLTPLKKEYNIVCEYDIKKGEDDEEDYLNQIIINSFEETKRNESWRKGTYIKIYFFFLFYFN
jgi:hypothetical protein